jgi:hypothetical protein
VICFSGQIPLLSSGVSKGLPADLQQLLATLGDAQTRINYHFNIDSRYILPIDCYWFEDGLYILRTQKEYSDLAGKRIVSVNGFPLDQVRDSLATLIVDDNGSNVIRALPRMITWTQLLQTFGFAETSGLELQVQDSPGRTITRRILLPAGEGEMVSAMPGSLPLGWQDRRAYFRDLYFPEEKIYYVQYNKCWSREAEVVFGTGASALFMPSFSEFEKRVLRTIRRRKVEKLVLDLRFNSGGTPYQGTRFIEELEDTGIGDRAEIFLVVGRETSGSAVINAADLMRTFDVTVVGENSGGSLNHFGEVKRFVLPASKLVVDCATSYIKLSGEDPPAIVPDILTPETYASFRDGIDPAFEAIRDYTAD